MKTSKAFKKYEELLKNKKHVFTQSEIIYFRKAIGVAGLKNIHERQELINLFMDNQKGYRITREHDELGRNYLISKSLKKNGQFRKGSKLGERELNILYNFSHHMFMGLQSQNSNRGFYDNWYLPIYRAYDKKGNYFDYIGTVYEQVRVL